MALLRPQSRSFLLMKWHAVKALSVLKALLKIGWSIDRQKGSHRILVRIDCPDYTFALRGSEEIGPKMLSRIARHTGLLPKDL